MLRDLGKQILHILSLPVRSYRTAVELLVSIRRFLDERRRHLAVAIIVAMMAVVGIKLRYTGYADAQPVEYLANAMPDPETIEETKDAAADSVTPARSGLASLSARANQPTASPRQRPNVPASVASSRHVDDSRPIRERTLILPMPMVVSSPNVEEPLTPDRASAQLDDTGEEAPAGESPVINAADADFAPEEAESISVPQPQPIAAARLTGQIEIDESTEHTVITPRRDARPSGTTGSKR